MLCLVVEATPLASLAAEGRVADNLADSLEVSLITCSPGHELYSLYGHTALRVRNLRSGEDIAFNYGIFNFKTPHFVWRFTLGECDYMCAALPYSLFLRDYEERGSYVISQRLNLTPEETLRLCRQLVMDSQPERCTYRYNYLTNNCTTKVRDAVAKALDGHLLLMPSGQQRTYRSMMQDYTTLHSWARLGDDVLLGAQCDTVLTDWAAMFLPFELARSFETALVIDPSGQARPLVEAREVTGATLQSRDAPEGSPMSVGAAITLFLILCLIIFLIERRTRQMLWLFDAFFMLLLGAAGCLLTFMFFFSEHPTLSSNWQVWVLNPLPLLCMPWVVAYAHKGKPCRYHWLNILILGSFLLVSPWLPQELCVAIVPLAVGSVSRSVSYCLSYVRRRR